MVRVVADAALGNGIVNGFVVVGDYFLEVDLVINDHFIGIGDSFVTISNDLIAVGDGLIVFDSAVPPVRDGCIAFKNNIVPMQGGFSPQKASFVKISDNFTTMREYLATASEDVVPVNVIVFSYKFVPVIYCFGAISNSFITVGYDSFAIQDSLSIFSDSFSAGSNSLLLIENDRRRSL